MASPGNEATYSSGNKEIPLSHQNDAQVQDQILSAGSHPDQLVTKVTSNNRTAARKREERQAKMAIQVRKRLGLVEPHKEAPPREHAAYASIPEHSEPAISWIFKQQVGNKDFYHANSSYNKPTKSKVYTQATAMLDKALAVGNQSAWKNISAFIRN